jgi:hypothetical protein
MINFSNYFQLNISQENIMEINLDPVQLGKFYPKNRQIDVLVCIVVDQYRFMLIQIQDSDPDPTSSHTQVGR